ncbi:MAG: choice-of-anchor D domain-containing protein [Bryobacteraceae bacterium]|jgi:hypothetical protein
MKRWRAGVLLLSLLAPAAHAQFSLYQVSGNADLPVGELFSFPTASPNMPQAVTFLIANTTNQAQTLALLSVSGVGFSLAGAMAPLTLQAGGSMQFTITFEAPTVASYSGSLVATGFSMTLTANVAPAVTYEVRLPSRGTSGLGAAAVNFGSVQVGASATVNFVAVNQTTEPLTVDAIGVAPGDFALVGSSPGGTPLDPQTSAGFSIEFSPTAAGARSAVLSIGSQQFTLTGTGVAASQFSLYQVTGNAGLLAGAQFSFGSVYPNAPATVEFSILNTTSQTQTVTVLSVSGAGFSVDAAAPMTLKANASVQFTLTFEGATAGSYSGSLDVAGIVVALTATATAGLTYEVELPSGASALSEAAVDFGSVKVGSNATLGFLAVNQTAAPLTVDSIGVAAGDFALVGLSPAGTSLAPQSSASFAIEFSPTAAGARTAVLSIGGRQFTLTGTGLSPPPPTPLLTVALGEAQSAQQGSVAVSFDAPAATGGTGTVTLEFQSLPEGELDPGILFAAGGQTANFTFNQGDTAASFGGAASAAFQTGTTAGTLTLAAQIGSAVSEQNVVIGPAVIGVAAVTGARQTSGVSVNVTGFDNTRTAGLLSFTFYDSSGNAIPPGAIVYDSTAAFTSYFGGSDDGGQFALEAYFPVTGDPTSVSAFTVQLANAAGTATTARTNF